MHSLDTNSASSSLSRAFQLREAVLLIFCDPPPKECAPLLQLSPGDWLRLLRWLDTSGLALYFLDRIEELGLSKALPLTVLARLQQNLADNRKRMQGMIAESVALQRRLQEARLSYAVLKGFSLWPISVPTLELRSQLDLDFLVAEEHAIEARRILEDVGYRLNAIAGELGRSWEFESTESHPSSLNNLYKSGMRRAIDLHLETASAGRTSRLSRTQTLSFHGIDMPVLSPVDLFLGQGLHVYQHVCCEFMRAAHLIEFRRHVIARYRDNAFWTALQKQVAGDSETCVRLGMVIVLISRVMGGFAPEELTCWTVGQLSAKANLWAHKYGHRTALASHPGSKLYLLLEEDMKPMGLAAKRSRVQALLPHDLPPSITQAVVGEGPFARMRRYNRESHFILFRLRFHLLAGVRYLRESILWGHFKNGVSQ